MTTDFDPSKDYYKALGVAPTATADEIKKAYRRLAKQCHPDSTGGDKAKESRFKEISAAYDVLGTAKKRQQYDAVRASGGRFGGMGPGGAGGMAGFDPRATGAPWDLGDLFAQHFSGASTSAGARGPRVRVEHFDFGDFGEQRRRPDSASDADFESTVRAADGSWLKVTGADVHSDVRVPFDRAILGTVATVATIDGKAEVKIPPGSSSGKKLRLRGKGRTEGGRVGDHYITVHIDVPSDLDEDAQKLLVQLVTRLRKRGRDA
ncbi:MAG: J domain-containing protein [Myxococcales bacterium]|nr:J domain-containing protein [Myxococcales bacterium]HRC55100.1 DnaJ domain-containing protein [Kofleriaceae bacterium]